METKAADHLREIQKRGIRLLFFDRIAEEIETGSVVIDDRQGAYRNVKHLLQQGYRKIIHVAGADHITIYRDRKQGYLDAMNGAGIEVPPDWIQERPLVMEGGEAAFLANHSSTDRPDAYFCAGDFAALGVLQAALKNGLRIPADLGISGFGNEPFTAFTHPTMTTVDQRGNEMGKNVAEMFMKCEDGKVKDAECEKLTLESQLIIRESSIQIR
jgi:LacI family transcriptional regulator